MHIMKGMVRTGSNLNSFPRRSMDPSYLSITASTEVEVERAAGRELVNADAPVARARRAAAVFMVQKLMKGYRWKWYLNFSIGLLKSILSTPLRRISAVV